MAPQSALLVALTTPEGLACAADRAWSRGDDRKAARLRLKLLRELLALRDRLTVVAERAGSPGAAVAALEHDLIEDLIAGRPEIWPVGARVTELLDAQVELLSQRPAHPEAAGTESAGPR